MALHHHQRESLSELASLFFLAHVSPVAQPGPHSDKLWGPPALSIAVLTEVLTVFISL